MTNVDKGQVLDMLSFDAALFESVPNVRNALIPLLKVLSGTGHNEPAITS